MQLRPISQEVFIFCRELYQEAIQNSVVSLPVVFPEMFDAAIAQPDAIFKAAYDEQGTWVGLIGIQNIRWVDRVCQLMMAVPIEQREKGWAAKVYQCAIDFCFNDLNLRRIVATCLEGKPFERILPRLGFEAEGFLREERFVNNEYKNAVIFGLFKSKE